VQEVEMSAGQGKPGSGTGTGMHPFQVDGKAFIGGAWVEADGDATFDVLNPASRAVVARVADCGAEQAKAAIVAASTAFPAWRSRSAKQRAELLGAWLHLIRTNAEELARLISTEHGKPLNESRWELGYAASNIEWFAEEAKRAYGEMIPAPTGDRRLMVVKEPVGVVALVTPWNFPLALLARKIAPALAAGCTVVAKPAEDTPLSALALARLAQEAGIPAGVVNVVPASREKAAGVVDTWLEDERVRKLSFTGSTAVGKHLARGAASTLKRVSLELGGNAPVIVFEDADLDLAVAGAVFSKFRNSGQTCLCANRIYVQAPVYDAFAERFAAAVAGLRVGSAQDGDIDQGPLINDRALHKVEAHIADSLAKGGRLLVGGRRLTEGAYSQGNYFQPTVLTHATSEMRLAGEETFGPVAPLFSFTDEEEVIAAANATQVGLAAYFYTRDIARVWRVADALEVGMVGINETSIAGEMVPFGGVKESGYGLEGSRHGLNEYLNTKYLCMGGLS